MLDMPVIVHPLLHQPGFLLSTSRPLPTRIVIIIHSLEFLAVFSPQPKHFLLPWRSIYLSRPVFLVTIDSLSSTHGPVTGPFLFCLYVCLFIGQSDSLCCTCPAVCPLLLIRLSFCLFVYPQRCPVVPKFVRTTMSEKTILAILSTTHCTEQVSYSHCCFFPNFSFILLNPPFLVNQLSVLVSWLCVPTSHPLPHPLTCTPPTQPSVSLPHPFID